MRRNGGRAGVAALVAILLLGLGLRLAEAWDGRAPVYDAAAYAKIAANLADGEGFTVGPTATQPSSNYSPGLPLLVAGIYELTGGSHERLARVVLALVGTLAVLFAYLLGRRLSGVVAGLIGATAVAIYPALLEYQGMLMGEPLATTLLSGAVLAILWAGDASQGQAARGSCRGGKGPAGEVYVLDPSPPRHPRVRWIWPGVLLGGLALVRPEYIGVAVLLGLAVICKERGNWRAGLACAGIMLAGVALVVVPWTVRNAVALDRFVPVSTGGGQVLFAGTYLPSDGDPERVGTEVVAEHPDLFGPDAVERLRLEQILARLAAHVHPGVEADQALARMGRAQLWDDLTGQPLEYADFLVAKEWRAWSRGPRDVMEEPSWRAFHLILIAFAALGLAVLASQRRWEALVFGVVLLAAAATVALLVASPRRVLVLLPLLAALAGVGVIQVLATQRSRH